MIEYRSTLILGKQGRIVIPLKIREMLGMKEGDMLGIECTVIDGVVTLFVMDGVQGLEK